MLFDVSSLKDSILQEIKGEIEPYSKKLEKIEKKIDKLIAILEPISNALNKIPFLK